MEQLIQILNSDTRQIHNAWIVSGDTATSYHNQAFKIPLQGKTIIEALRDRVGCSYQLDKGNYEQRISPLALGEYHPRICWWVEGHGFQDLPADEKLIHSASRQLQLLYRMLESTFSTVEPAECHFNVYGHVYRNILLLAATEFETQCRGVLLENGYSRNGNLTTADFVKLKGPMMLEEFRVSLRAYPWLGAFSPLSKWEAGSPTQSLDWYHAYNLIKHDREANEKQATMSHAMQAITAVYIMLVAQYGPQRNQFLWLRGKFKIATPSTLDPSRVYFRGKWKERAFTF